MSSISETRGNGGETHQTGGEALTTNHGVPISDNQNSLKAGARGPTLLEDFVLREKIFHFDHERIPERIVHARGSAAHGYFEATDDISDRAACTRRSTDGSIAARARVVSRGTVRPRVLRGFFSASEGAEALHAAAASRT